MAEIGVVLLLILLNGLLAMSEIALISARKSHLAAQAKRGSRAAKVALDLAREPDKFLATVQIGITVIGILTGLYSGSVLADDFSEVLVGWGVGVDSAHWLAQTVIVVAVTYLTLVFGELLPKRIGMGVAEKAAKVVARPMRWLSVVGLPFVWLLSKSTSALFSLLGFKADQNRVTEAEIKSLVDEGTRSGAVAAVEQDIVERVFLLGDLKVSSLMTHRSEVVVLEGQMSPEQVRAVVEAHRHECYPVIDSKSGYVQGVVWLKELFFSDFELGKVLQSAVYFPETMSVYNALEQIKVQRLSYALICDEFGSFQGVIALKDMLEGLVGVIEEAHSEPDIIACPDRGGWLVDGQCPLHDFLSHVEREELHPLDADYNTLGGLILAHLGHIPTSGERVLWHDLAIDVVDMDGVRIDKVWVTPIAL